jgi:ribosomal protein S18 acetylase RimI-like enzyme
VVVADSAFAQSTLSDAQADAIAELLNTRNQLTIQYTRKRVLEASDDYIPRLSDSGEVVACVQIKKVQWYQAEVLHLTVAEACQRKGHAKALLCEAEQVARNKRVRILQCTIRADNIASRKLFEGFGFVNVSTFFNEESGNVVGVFQKALVIAR